MGKLRKLAGRTLMAAGIVLGAFIAFAPIEAKADEMPAAAAEMPAVPEGMVAVATQDGGVIIIPLEVQEKLLWENYVATMKETDLLALRAGSDDEHWNAYLESLPQDVCNEVVTEYKAQGGEGSDEYLTPVQTVKTEEAQTEETQTDETPAADTADDKKDAAIDKSEDKKAGDKSDGDSDKKTSEDVKTEDKANASKNDKDADLKINSDIQAKSDDVNERIKSLSEKLERLNKSLDKMTAGTDFATGDNSDIIEETAKYLEENPEVFDYLDEVATKDELEMAEAISENAVSSLEGLSDEEIKKLKDIANASLEIVEQGKKLSTQFATLKKAFEKINFSK